MTALSSSPAPSRRAPWLVAALHLPFVIAAPLFVFTRDHHLGAGTAVIVLCAAATIGALQLRHSLAAARGAEPAGWPLTYAALCLLAYLPGIAFGLDWVSTTQWFVVASGAMLLPRRWVSVAIVVPSVVAMVWIADFVGRTEHGSPLRVVIWMLYYLVVTLLGGLALYWSTRLTRVLDQLGRARTELADLAVGRERLRVSRDLHDLLGHSLSAVSLKGDLALRLLPVDADRAREEIESLTQLARATLRDMRAVTRDQHAVSLRSEVDAAVAMLAAADVRTRVVLEVRALPPAVEVVLAWAVREAATNILRHSDATECSITASRHAGTVRLEIVNDGAIASSTGAPRDGHGLAGIDERARTLSGSATGSDQAGGVYRLLVEVPEGAR